MGTWLLCLMGANKKYGNNQGHQLHRTNHENFVKLRRVIENTAGFQWDPARQVINLSKKRFTLENLKLLNKNLNFVRIQTNFNNITLSKELEEFYRRIKLKSHFKILKTRLALIKKTYLENLISKKESPQYRSIHRSNTQWNQ